MNSKEIKAKTEKQGSCGMFCFYYWLGGGCLEDCPYDYRMKTPLLNKLQAEWLKKNVEPLMCEWEWKYIKEHFNV